MATLIYATSDDYEALFGTPPANIDRLLRSASLLIARNIVTAVYDADSDGLPTDSDTVAALVEATCTQANAWAAAGVDPTSGAVATDRVIASKSLDGGSVTYDTGLSGSVTLFQAKQAMASQLCPDAAQILAAAGLVGFVLGYG